MDVFDQIEQEVTAKLTAVVGSDGVQRPVEATVMPGAVAGVLRGLKAAGMSFLDVLQWLPVVLKLVKEVTPLITEVIRIIREAIDQGKTPQTFFGVAESQYTLAS